jgi:hypothetical protein
MISAFQDCDKNATNAYSGWIRKASVAKTQHEDQALAPPFEYPHQPAHKFPAEARSGAAQEALDGRPGGCLAVQGWGKSLMCGLSYAWGVG